MRGVLCETAKGGQIDMKTEALQKHIYDTVKEWQMKIGYREENMKLYYPDISLKGLLGLDRDADSKRLDEALALFAEAMQPQLGKIRVSCDEKKERYCLDVPAEGAAYIAKEVPDSVFLKKFFGVITAPGSTLGDVRACFAGYAGEQGSSYREFDRTEDGLGHVFYFEGHSEDEYIYCVESDDFGLTYHRFDREDYEKLVSENAGESHAAHECIMCQ